jgi:hypothetical protein
MACVALAVLGALTIVLSYARRASGRADDYEHTPRPQRSSRPGTRAGVRRLIAFLLDTSDMPVASARAVLSPRHSVNVSSGVCAHTPPASILSRRPGTRGGVRRLLHFLALDFGLLDAKPKTGTLGGVSRLVAWFAA